MMWLPKVWGILALITQNVIGNDLYSSMVEMRQLYENEEKLMNQVESHLEAVDKQIKILDEFLELYKDHNVTQEEAEEYVSNPINTYVMIKRQSKEWPKVREAVFSDKAKEDINDIVASLGMYDVTEEDLEGASNGLFLLQETYNFNITEFATGKLKIPEAQVRERGGGPTYVEDSSLRAHDLEILAKIAFNKDHYHRAYDFFQAAVAKAVQDKEKPEMIKILKSGLKTTIRIHDQYFLKKAEFGGLPEFKTYPYPLSPELAKKKKYAKLRKKAKEAPKFELFRDLKTTKEWEQFHAICSGQQLRDPIMDKDLTCDYIHYNNPYLRIGPFKLETKNKAPFVGIFRNFMYDSEMDAFKAHGEANLKRSSHAGKEGFHSSWERTSKQSWMWEWLHDDPEMVETYNVDNIVFEGMKVTNRISLATRMPRIKSYAGSEPYQVANYGLGGVYNHHTDAGGEGAPPLPGPEDHGDRIQTFMAYLSDVEAGGATAFTNLGLAVWPSKGDAITWYNMFRNGQLDGLTFHGGCPVIKGSKWITNKWIRWYYQSLIFPCSIYYPGYERLPLLTSYQK